MRRSRQLLTYYIKNLNGNSDSKHMASTAITERKYWSDIYEHFYAEQQTT